MTHTLCLRLFARQRLLERLRGCLVVAIVLWGAVCAGNTPTAEADAPGRALQWPPVTTDCRPWSYWWWMGNAVDQDELTRHLEEYSRAGMGGLHIVTIYGAEGAEDRYLDFLSPTWMDMLAHTVGEARRVGMGIDMTPGSKWPYGGPWVRDEDSPKMVLFDQFEVSPGDRVERAIRKQDRKGAPAKLQSLMAFSPSGRAVELTDRVDPSGRLDWTAPKSAAGNWKLYALFQGRTYRRVGRAAPGGEGNVVDHFNPEAFRRYLDRFDEAFAGYPSDNMVRAFYFDSYEIAYANWTDRFLEQFKARRGYDLRRQLPAFRGKADRELVTRVRSDYHETLSDLMLECATIPWVDWAHGKGAITRNQAHGSPANILDLYAASDVPETETFGSAWLDLLGETPLPGSFRDYGNADILTLKFASSAAHVTGKRLTGCETCTWLGEHFRVPLAHAKAEIDLVLTAGINHVIYHGMTYSPADAGWPGWLFFASTNFGPSNTFWRDLPALNAYVARCQSFLQAGRPDNDVLLYFPIYDLWAQPSPSSSGLHRLGIHWKGTHWLNAQLEEFSDAARRMQDRGVGFDFVSDRQLRDVITTRDGRLAGRDSSYRALVVAGCRWMPPETLERIAQLVRDGATVVFLGDLPADVPGLGALDTRHARLARAKTELVPIPVHELPAMSPPKPNPDRKGAGPPVKPRKGRVLQGDDFETLLLAAGIRRETMTDRGIRLVRRKDGDNWVYFLVNQGQERIDDWIPLSVDAESIVWFDPMHAQRGLAARSAGTGQTDVYLQLEPGQSCVLRALPEKIDGPRWIYATPTGESHELSGPWKVTFVEGGPSVPDPLEMPTLRSWTDSLGAAQGDAQWAARRAFSGTARYEIDFTRPKGADDAWLLDLGDVAHSARVTLNGRPLGTVFARPYQIALGGALREGTNHLAIEVTNLMANRIIDLDRRGVDWRKYYFVHIRSGRYDRSGKPPDWKPFDSGLLGPVRLVRTKAPTTSRGRPIQ